MKGGEDGARDHNGDLLPVLSESATKMNYERLVNTPLPKFNKNYPGSPFFYGSWIFLLKENLEKPIPYFRGHRN